jgi:hypothetical protein
MAIETKCVVTCDLCGNQKQADGPDDIPSGWIETRRGGNARHVCGICIEEILSIKNAYCQ